MSAHRALYREHGELVSRLVHDGLTEAETARLAAVRKRLDEIEMAAMAPAFERLEAQVVEVETVRDEVLGLLDEFEAK